jgi:hypothetical protein
MPDKYDIFPEKRGSISAGFGNSIINNFDLSEAVKLLFRAKAR